VFEHDVQKVLKGDVAVTQLARELHRVLNGSKNILRLTRRACHENLSNENR
jgi:hypothetical protein